MFAINKIGIYDLRYTLLADLNTPKGLNLVWDDVHAVATLQGVVNSCLLYTSPSPRDN